MNKTIFLDRDGTINVDKGYLYRKEDFEFLPDTFSALRLLQDAGYLLIIITNQSGIARGYYTEGDLKTLNNWMLKELKKHGVAIAKIYYCPHHPEAKITEYRKECSCRKPKLGMFKQAMEDFNIDVDNSYAIGDKIRDCSICTSTGCHGFLIADNEMESVIEAVKCGKYERVEYASSLLNAAQRILN